MLHRNFKPAKCKTALKLAVSRIKLLKNKREAQVKQLKRELAKLLESGQDQSARIRVEHVVREEKTLAAYDLIEIYCELIAARLPMIESQKNCPIDLKEAVSSVIFATPRCADLPELMDVKKQITSKYGKEFVSAAIELRPDSGVNRMLVEKLSAKAPDGPAKMKILSSIAEEHNIKWEPKSFGENDVKSSQDSAGPSTFEKTAYLEPFQVHVPPPVHDEKGPLDSHATSQPKPMHHAPTNSYQQNASAAARNASGNHSTTPGMPNPEIRSSGDGSQEMDSRDSYSENRGSFSAGRQNWNMEFKDAASAARSAAESAERANLAARAAAEFSNRENITRQYSNGSHSSSGSGSRDEIPKEYAFHDDKHLSTASVNSTFCKSSSGLQNEQATAGQQDNEYYRNSHQNVVKHAQSSSMISGGGVGNVKSFTDSSEMVDTYHHGNLFKQQNSDLDEMSLTKQASRIEEDFMTELHGDGDWNTDFKHVRTNKQFRKDSSPHLIIPSDDSDNLNLNSWAMGSRVGEDHFVTEANKQTSAMKASSYNDASVVFDDSGSENDDYKLDAGKKYKDEGYGLFLSSPGSKSQFDQLENSNSWGHGQNTGLKETSFGTPSHFSVSEKLTKSEVTIEKEDLLAVFFDDSDDPGSDNEVDLVKSNHGALGSSSRNVKNHGPDRKSWSSPSSVGSDNMEEHSERKVDATTMSGKNHGYDNLLTREPSSTRRSSISGLGSGADFHTLQSPDNLDNADTLEKSLIESGTELTHGTLKGGFRNKGYRRPPNIKNTSDDVSSSLGDISVQTERSLPTVRTSTSSNSPVQDTYTKQVSRGNRNVGLRTHNKSSDSDNYDLIANSQDMTGTLKTHIPKEQSEAKKKSSSRVSIPFFDSDYSDSDDELRKQNSASVVQPESRTSRRTTGTVFSSKDAPSEAPATSLGWKSSRVSYESKNQMASPTIKSSENWAGSMLGSAENEARMPISELNRSLDDEIIDSSARVQSASSVPKSLIRDSEGQKALNSQNSDGDTPSKQKAGHVHPKLPDYDSFAAHFLSLKKDRP